MPTASNRINFTWADSSTKYWDVSSKDGDTLYFVENDGIYIGARKVADNLFFNKEIILEPINTDYFPGSNGAISLIPVQWDPKKYGYMNGSTSLSTELVYLNNKNVLSNGQIFTLLFNNIQFRGLTTLGINGAIQLRISSPAPSAFPSGSYYYVYKNYNEYLYPTDIIEFGSTVDSSANASVESIKLVYLEFPGRTGAFYLLGKLPIPSGKVIPGKSVTRQVVDYNFATYALAMEIGDGDISPLATSSSVSSTNKIKNPIGFLPGGKIYLNLGPTVTSGTYINGTNANISKWNIYTELSNSAFNLKYSSNCGNNFGGGKDVYVIFNEGDDGRWYLDDSWCDTVIRPGKICVPIGISTSLAGYTAGSGYIENFCGTNRALTCSVDGGAISEFVSKHCAEKWMVIQ